MGMPCGACGVTGELWRRSCPRRRSSSTASATRSTTTGRESIGKVRAFHGVPATVVRALAWVLASGADGLREVAETAVLNNNYLAQQLADDRRHRRSPSPRATPTRRLEQVRYSLARARTRRRASARSTWPRRPRDFGLTQYFPSHEPWLVPEPMTLEPSESYSRADLDTYAAILRQISEEAYSDPEVVLSSPHRSTVHKLEGDTLNDPERWALTWRAYRRKGGQESGSRP